MIPTVNIKMTHQQIGYLFCLLNEHLKGRPDSVYGFVSLMSQLEVEIERAYQNEKEN